jgi:predicted transcriptional regulator of viral defense system
MRILDLNKISSLYFSTADIARILHISPESAKVTASRYTMNNLLIRLKKDIYILKDRLSFLTEKERFRLANIIQTPSYISLTTALSYYGLSTQQQQNFIESVAIKRTKSITVVNITFSYNIIKKELYNGFELQNDFFIALPEKALADAIYLTSIGKYRCDFHAIHFDKIDKQKVQTFLKNINRNTQLYWERLCKNFNI